MRDSKLLNTLVAAFGLAFIFGPPVANATSLSLGADYDLRGVANTPSDKTIHSDRYYDQQLQAYLTTDLSRDVEASVRVQSITPWGLEGSTTPLRTRYPDANGGLWVQNAYARMPHIWNDHIIVTVGRQPIQWGDGKILSDDDLGFDAIRAQVKSPFRRIPFDVEGFTAKIHESLNQSKRHRFEWRDDEFRFQGLSLGIDGAVGKFKRRPRLSGGIIEHAIYRIQGAARHLWRACDHPAS